MHTVLQRSMPMEGLIQVRLVGVIPLLAEIHSVEVEVVIRSLDSVLKDLGLEA
jgi:hypothetical protein